MNQHKFEASSRRNILASTLNINFKLLQAFVLVAEYNSFRAAAEISHRSPSATSMQIKQLEDQLGVSLFHRTSRYIELTPEGNELLQAAHQALATLNASLRTIQDTVDLQKGSVCIGCVSSIASTRLPYVLAIFEDRYPGIAVHVREMLSIPLLEAIRRQEVDFGIGPKTDDSKAFSFRQILIDEVVALVPQNFKLANKHKRGITLREISKFPVLPFSSHTTLHENLARLLEREKITLATKHEVAQPHTAIAMAAAGLGIAMLPRMLLPPQGHPSLRILRLEGFSLSRQISIISRRGHALSPAATHLVQMIEQFMDTAKRKTKKQTAS